MVLQIYYQDCYGILQEAFIDPDDKADFHIRAGTTTLLLNPKETAAYIRDHFQN